MESLGRTLGQQRFQGFPSSALLSLAFQCIHVSGEPSFSSENKLLWEFLVHAVSFSHTASCLIILTLLTTDSGRILFSLQRKLYHLARVAAREPSAPDANETGNAGSTWRFFHFNQSSPAEWCISGKHGNEK